MWECEWLWDTQAWRGARRHATQVFRLLPTLPLPCCVCVVSGHVTCHMTTVVSDLDRGSIIPQDLSIIRPFRVGKKCGSVSGSVAGWARMALGVPFSWKHLPVAFHSSSSGAPFSESQVRELARYSMVTLEKYQNIAGVAPVATLSHPYESEDGLYACQRDQDLSRCGCCAEDEIVSTARAIKAINPGAVIVAYLNAQISYPWYRSAREMAANAAWWLTDAKHAGPSNSTWKTFDLTVPGAARSWQQAALNLTATGVIDSVFADGCVSRERGPTPARVEEAARTNRTRGLGPLRLPS